MTIGELIYRAIEADPLPDDVAQRILRRIIEILKNGHCKRIEDGRKK